MLSLVVKDCIDREDLLVGLLRFFNEAVSIAYFKANENLREDILYECIPMKGDFCFELCIYTSKEIDTKELSIFLCDFWGTEILISDEDVNPYTWILITKEGVQGKVNQIVNDSEEFLIKR